MSRLVWTGGDSKDHSDRAAAAYLRDGDKDCGAGEDAGIAAR